MEPENNYDNIESRIAGLINLYLTGRISTEESRELLAWVDETPAHAELFHKLTSLAWQEKSRVFFDSTIPSAQGAARRNNQTGIHVPWLAAGYKYAAVLLSVVVLSGIALWYFLPGDKNTTSATAAGEDKVGPGMKYAQLMRSGGKVFYLSPSNKTGIGRQCFNDTDGLHYYRTAGSSSDTDRLSVPSGNAYRVTLGDGTVVWLHPSTRIAYPVAFSVRERTVRLEGDAFFQVAKDHSRPFRVLCGGSVTEAVGTSFNVSGSGSKVTTSLVEGVVIVTYAGRSRRLTAGNQITAGPGMGLDSPTALDTTVAESWRNGDFIFRASPLGVALEQLSLWYGFRVKMASGLDSKKLTATIGRNEPIADVLQLLGLTGIARFRLEGNTLYVQP